MKRSFRSLVFFHILGLAALGAEPEKITGIRASASTEHKDYKAANAVDGVISDASRWVCKAGNEQSWLLLEWDEIQAIQGIHLYTGYGEIDPIRGFTLSFRDADGQWVVIPSAIVTDNARVAVALRFDATVEVKTNALKLTVTDTKGNRSRVKEVIVWKDTEADMPAIPGEEDSLYQAALIPPIYLNQSGFNRGEPKRFTAPTLPDDTPFSIKAVDGGQNVYQGIIRGHLGDFSDFDPNDSREYVIEAGDHRSVPFTVGLWHFERIVYQRSIDFMIDSRHHVGTYRKPCQGSFGWRDDHHFAWVLRTIVPQYLSNPAAYERMPRQIEYEPPVDKLWGALEPYDPSAPDIVKLIHWGADVTVTQGTTHEFLKGELAYFLYAWPLLKPWLPEQNYQAVLAFVETHWADEKADQHYPYDESDDHNLFALKPKFGSTKGGYPPGHNLMPNLLMHAVAKRDGLANAERYFAAAHAQAEWMSQHLDWENPQVTKGQRLSEHITMTGLATFLEMHPGRAPEGLRESINRWAEIMVRRSENMWDFRKLTDDGDWTPSGTSRVHWNEVGNVVGFPAALLAAEPFVEDPAIRKRFVELVWSHIDNSFGRNPTGRHFSYDAPREIEGVEHGWYSYHIGGIGQLDNARFTLDGAPKHVHYPYHPEHGNYGWTEGWVNFNTAFNHSLAYMAKASTDLQLKQEGDHLVVNLRAPLNFDITRPEPIEITVEAGKKSARVKLVESAPDSPIHTCRIALKDLGVGSGDTLRSAYGFGYMKSTAELEVK